ncbi:MAG: hypothetical protein DI529_11960 [Chryseobacterium sp.]|nr:MAG: hypothetical protein DI529_11960 [Chryseobacterium sp.]
MKITGRVILVTSLLILSILSYKMSTNKKNPDINLPKPKFEYNVQRDVPYKSDSESDYLKLDIYQPKNIKKRKLPVVIYLHGGAWTRGNKDAVQNNFRAYIMEELIKNQYAVISINYTLLNKNTHLEQPLQDTKDALDWINKNTEKYNLDIHNVGIWGGSAGGHIALLTAYNQQNKLPVALKYVINYFAPTDLTKLFKTDASSLLLTFFKIYSPDRYNLRKEKIMELTGFDISKDKSDAQKKCDDFSPIRYISRKTIPTLIFHGTEDSIVDISQSQLLKETLEKNKVYHQFFILEKAKHSFSNITKEEAQDIAKKTVDFIKSQTK